MSNMAEHSKIQEFLSTKEVANWIGVSVQTIHRLVMEDSIPTYRVGRLLKFRRSDVEKYLESVKVKSLEESFKSLIP